MTIVVIRFLIIYFLMTCTMKRLGKRQIGQMQQSEFVTTLFLSELACFVVTDVSFPLLFGILPVLLMLSIEVLISFGSIKVPFIKRLFDEPSSFLIRSGKIDQKEIKKNRITIEELISMVRLAGTEDISMVRDAILEPNGQLSVIKKDASETPFAVIQDGKINHKALTLIGKDQMWLKKVVGKKAPDFEDLFLVLADQNGVRYIVRKE